MAKRKFAWLVVLALAAALVVMLISNGDSDAPFTIKTSPSATPVATKKTTPTASPKPTPVLSYSQAVSKYSDSRLQFAERCQMTPYRATFKNSTTIMLDNRDSVARVITLDGNKYSLAAYGFKVLTLSYTQLPKTIEVDCGAYQNVGTIIVQK